MTYQINYSFTFRDDSEVLYSVNVPLKKLEGLELNLENVRSVVEEDLDLIADLMGPNLKSYESMIMAPHVYHRELQRFDENVSLVNIKERASVLDADRVEATLRKFVSLHVDYDIHKNFEHDEETGEDAYPDLTREFIKLYENQ